MRRFFQFGVSSGFVALGVLLSSFALGILSEEAYAGCVLCGGTCSDTTDPEGSVVCPAAATCTGAFCVGTCACTANAQHTAFSCA